jgi:hypothetical protein
LDIKKYKQTRSERHMKKKLKDRLVEASNYGTLIIIRITYNNKKNFNVSAIRSTVNKFMIIK